MRLRQQSARTAGHWGWAARHAPHLQQQHKRYCRPLLRRQLRIQRDAAPDLHAGCRGDAIMQRPEGDCTRAAAAGGRGGMRSDGLQQEQQQRRRASARLARAAASWRPAQTATPTQRQAAPKAGRHIKRPTHVHELREHGLRATQRRVGHDGFQLASQLRQQLGERGMDGGV